MIWFGALTFFIIGLSAAWLAVSTVMLLFVGVLSFLHIKFNEFSVKFSRLCPLVVSL